MARAPRRADRGNLTAYQLLLADAVLAGADQVDANLKLAGHPPLTRAAPATSPRLPP